jgi:hypothetical protein
MRTLRQGCVSIMPSPAVDLAIGPRPAVGVSGYQESAGGHEEGADADQERDWITPAAERRLHVGGYLKPVCEKPCWRTR